MIRHITLRVIAHATEDISRVREALDFFLLGSGVQGGKERIEELSAEGHHGNPIVILSVQLNKKAECLDFAHFIRENLSEKAVERLRGEMPERLDENQVFHLRFGKQAAYLHQLELTETSDAITVKVKIETYPRSREKAGAIVEELFG